VEARSGDSVFEAFGRLGIDSSELPLEYETAAGPVGRSGDRWLGTTEAMVWADVVESTRDNARLSVRFAVYMAVAGVIAGFGVINKSPILIVGAMAVSPDFYPTSAACMGLVQRWWGSPAALWPPWVSAWQRPAAWRGRPLPACRRSATHL
jgi:hypothetical protein